MCRRENIAFEERYGEDRFERLAASADESIAPGGDVLADRMIR